MKGKSYFSYFLTLVEEANERIKKAVKSNDIKGCQIGQTMLEVAVKKVEKTSAALEKVRNEQKLVEKNKRTMLDYLASEVKKIKK